MACESNLIHMLVILYKGLLEHNHTYFFKCGQWLLFITKAELGSYHRDHITYKAEDIY